MKEIYRIHTVQLRTPSPSFRKKCIFGKQSTSANMWTQLNTTANGKSAQTRPWLSKARASDDPNLTHLQWNASAAPAKSVHLNPMFTHGAKKKLCLN
jgi:hypothetical protein